MVKIPPPPPSHPMILYNPKNDLIFFCISVVHPQLSHKLRVAHHIVCIRKYYHNCRHENFWKVGKRLLLEVLAEKFCKFAEICRNLVEYVSSVDCAINLAFIFKSDVPISAVDNLEQDCPCSPSSIQVFKLD